ncbi:hypothetical protein POTOM_014054 [Populus tomentosa]|uniref:Uncharacterized protein n=1 Tax=Populus tomentosa TaxID=118781 RepID=A0A8X8AHG8_POPTO|nr:hypothetical protein POTOM_014054 [Populus tomentosa]
MLSRAFTKPKRSPKHGERPLGMTEKVVLLRGKVYALRRFRALRVRRREFGKRIERLAQVSKRCEYLVPVIAYLYTKRIKFVVWDYFPMGSLAHLLAGEKVISSFLNLYTVEGKERKQALLVLDIALQCADKVPEARPPIEQTLRRLGDVLLIK